MKLPAIVLLILMTLCLQAEFLWPLGKPLRLDLLDIGQGDSILIQTPHGRVVLIDGGPGVKVLERLGEELSFWHSDIDLLVLTHPDLDHLEGLVEILPRFRVHRVLMTGIQHGSKLYGEFLDRLERYDLEVILADPQQDWLLDKGVVLDVISPQPGIALKKVENANDTSIVTRLVYGDSRVLLSGDAEEEQELDILRSEADIRAEIYKVGHHGSRTSSHERFVRAIGAPLGLVQAGRENRFGHPHLEVLLRLEDQSMEWANTGQEGTLSYVSYGQEWHRLK